MSLTLENDLAHRIIGYAIDIHKVLGPGLDPKIYLECLEYELESSDIFIKKNIQFSANYKELHFPNALQIDLLADNKVAVIFESTERISDYQIQKLLKLLKIEQLKLGLIINFNTVLLKDGIRRVTNHKLIESLSGLEYQE